MLQVVASDVAPAPSSSADRATNSLGKAILVFRWGALIWVAINAWSEQGYTRPWLIVTALAVATLWTLWLTISSKPVRGPVLAVDLGLAAGMNIVSGLVVPPGQVVVLPLFALSYPFGAILAAGASYGPTAGILAGVLMSVSYFVTRPVNGLFELTSVQLKHLANGSIQFVFAGLLFGVVSSLLRRSADEVRTATAEAILAREKAARLAERESLARQIHDSALQVLALIHKKGIELAETGAPPPQEVAALAELAKEQESALRSLILRKPEDVQDGRGSLRDALERVTAGIKGLEVSVSSVGPVWLPTDLLRELVAAIEQAIANVQEHARASKIAVFADSQGGLVQVTVRDDGIGFEFDEARFRSEGKFGVLNSMKGRIEAVGGEMRLESIPGSGTEVEFRVPVP
jgi:signal transduction histidine kinase